MTTVEQLQLLLSVDDRMTGRLNDAINGLKALETQAGFTAATIKGIFSGSGSGAAFNTSSIQDAQRAAQQAAVETQTVQTSVARAFAAEEAKAAASVKAEMASVAAATKAHFAERSAAAAEARAYYVTQEREKAVAAKAAADETRLIQSAAAAARKQEAAEVARWDKEVERSFTTFFKEMRQEEVAATRAAAVEEAAIRKAALASVGLPAGAPMPPIGGGGLGGPGVPPIAFALAAATPAASTLQQALGGLGGLFASLSSGAQGLGSAIGGLVPPFLASAAASLAHAGAIGLAFGAVYGAVSAFKQFVSAGFEFNTLIETTQVGLSALILTFKDLSVDGVMITDNTEKYAAAMTIAADTTDMLRMAAFGTVGTLEDLSKGFNKLFAAGGATRATREEIVTLTMTVANLAVALQIPFETAYRQISLLLQGVTRTQGQIGAFARELGITPEVARSWLAAGDNVTKLNEKLVEFAKMGPRIQDTFEGLKSQVLDIFQQLSGATMQPVWEELKTGMKDFVSMFVTFREGELPTFRKESLDAATIFGEGFRGALKEIERGAKVSLGLVTDYMKDAGLGWLDVVKIFVTGTLSAFALMSKGIQGILMTITHPIETSVGYAGAVGGGGMAYIADMLEKQQEAAGGKGNQGVIDFLRKTAIEFSNTNEYAKRFETRIGAIGSMADTLKPLNEAIAGIGLVASHTAYHGLADMGAKVRAVNEAALLQLKDKGLSLDAQFYDSAGTLEGKLKAIDLRAREAADGIRKLVEATRTKPENIQAGPLFQAALNAEQAELLAKVERNAEEERRRATEDSHKKALAAMSKANDEQMKLREDWLKSEEKLRKDALSGEEQYQHAIAQMATVGAETKEQNVQRAYDRGMEQLRRNQVAGQAGLDKELAALREGGSAAEMEQLAAKYTHLEDLTTAGEARLLAIKRSADTRNLALDKGDWATYEAELAKHYEQMGGMNAYAAMRKAAKDTAETQMSAAQTGAEGAAAAWKYLSATVKSEADTQRDYVLDTWRTMRQGFDDLLFTGLSGKWSDFGSVFKSISDGILKNFTKTIGDMVERWALGQSQMGKYKNDPDYVASRDPANAKKGGVWGTGLSEGQALGTFFAVAGAAGGMATGGAQSFWGGMSGYLSIAASLASTVPILAAAVAAAGVIVNIMAERQENVEYFKLMGNRNQQIGNTPGEQSLFDMRDYVASSLAEIFLKGTSASDARTLMTQLNFLVYDYIKDKWFSVIAGSDADFAADIKKLISGVFPSQLLHVAFGSPGGTRAADIAGIGGARQYDASIFDANAPIPKFLSGLGFTAEKIKELSLQIDLVDPKVWMEKFRSLVEIVVRFNTAIETLGKSSSDVWRDVLQERGTGPGASFAKQADSLALLAEQLNLYAGDEQIAKAKELAALMEQYVSAQRTAITQLMDLAAGFVKTVNDQLLKNADAGKSQDWLMADAKRRVGGVFMGQDFNAGTLSGARTADQVTLIAQQAFNDLQFIWNGLMGMKAQAEGLKTSFADLAKNLSMSNAEIWDAAHKNPFRVIAENIADINAKVAYAGTLETGSQAWLDVMQQISTDGVATFEAIADQIDRIHSAQVSMNESIDDQINNIRRQGLGNQAQLDKWNQEIDKLTKALAKGGMSAEETAWDQNRLATLQGYTTGYDPHQQIDDLKATIEENRRKLATAQTPEEIQRLQGLISRDTNTYLGLFNNENQTPETQASAREWATEQLRATQREANAAFDAMNAVLTHARETLRDTITGIGPMMEDATTKLRDELWHVQMAFERLRNEVNAAYVAMAGSITDPNAGLLAALDSTRAYFTDTLNPTFHGLNFELGEAATAVRKFKEAFDNPNQPPTNPVTTKGSGAAGQSFGTTPTAAGNYGLARTIDMARRTPSLLTASGVQA